jgi:hypothetical protein
LMRVIGTPVVPAGLDHIYRLPCASPSGPSAARDTAEPLVLESAEVFQIGKGLNPPRADSTAEPCRALEPERHPVAGSKCHATTSRTHRSSASRASFTRCAAGVAHTRLRSLHKLRSIVANDCLG